MGARPLKRTIQREVETQTPGGSWAASFPRLHHPHRCVPDDESHYHLSRRRPRRDGSKKMPVSAELG
jgi:hypothetical protein